MIAVLQTGLLVLFFGFAAVVTYRLMTSDVAFRGLATHMPGGETAMDRMQAIVSAVGAASAYLWIAVTDMSASAEPLRSLPDVPNWMLTIFGSSQAVYLGGKLWALPRKEQ